MTQEPSKRCPLYACSVSLLAKVLLGAGVITASLQPGSAQALVMPDTHSVEFSGSTPCSPRRFEPAADSRPVTQAGTTKASSIIGGQPSALELIRQQQQQLVPETTASLSPPSAPNAHMPYFNSCFTGGPLDLLAAAPAPATTAPQPSRAFLGSSLVGIRSTPFNDDWQRVSSASLASSSIAYLLDDAGQADLDTLSEVNRWANHNIEYADDLTTYGTRDYWATASETLESGRGDCEDLAILKYQMLAAMGFDRRQMFLTLARDLVRNADHAVLIVRVGGRHYMLDNATDALLPATTSYDYRPTMSFNTESAWLHGLRRPVYLSDNAVSSARVTGFNR